MKTLTKVLLVLALMVSLGYAMYYDAWNVAPSRFVVRYETLKAYIRSAQERASQRIHFFFAFRSERPIAEHLKDAQDALEKIRQRRKEKSE